jgi:NhaP-type Na+/H+ and K+/H+ antiporters
MAAVPHERLAGLAVGGLAISAVVIGVRLIWVPASAFVPRWLSRRRRREPVPPASQLFLVGWTSMRGIVSLAAALGLPLALANGAPFPHRAEIILVTVTVIVVTLVLQGLTLAPLIRWFHFEPEHELEAEEEYARGEHCGTASRRWRTCRASRGRAMPTWAGSARSSAIASAGTGADPPASTTPSAGSGPRSWTPSGAAWCACETRTRFPTRSCSSSSRSSIWRRSGSARASAARLLRSPPVGS